MLTILVLSFLVISLAMLAMAIGQVYGRPAIHSVCGGSIDGGEDRAGEKRCDGCPRTKLTECAGRC